MCILTDWFDWARCIWSYSYFSSIEYKLSSDVRQVTAVVKDYQISVKTGENGDEDVKYHAILSFEVDGKTYTGKDVFSRDISRGNEVTEKAYRALNGEYKLYTGDIGDNITSVMMIPAGIIISIFLIYEIFGKSKEKEQEEQ